MKIIVFNGLLGNQMFIYAYTLALKKRFPCSIVLMDIKRNVELNNMEGCELTKVFPHIKVGSYNFNRRIHNLHTKYWTKILFHTYKEKEEYYGTYIPFNSDEKFVVFEGFWQSEKYFETIASKIHEIFFFDERRLNKKTSLLYKELKYEQNSVSVHIRKGDYVNYAQYFGGTCSLSYYEAALRILKERVPDAKLYFFSDDMEWTKKNFGENSNAHFVDWNIHDDSWQDMFLMSKCKHNIIANSTFSWWGAYLNKNPQKIVLAPARWFSNIDAIDIVPENWIKVRE